MVVAGPKSGLFHSRSAHTTRLSGVISRACTSAFDLSMVVLHMLTQLLTRVFPFGRRLAVWNPERRYAGTSSGLNSQTVCPSGSTSRTTFLLLAIRVLPFFNRTADHGPSIATDQTSLPAESYSETFFISMWATRSVPEPVRRARRNCP